MMDEEHTCPVKGRSLRTAVLVLLSFLCLLPPLIRCSRAAEGYVLFANVGAFRYFTIDSNLFCGIAALCEAVQVLRRPEGDAPEWTSVFLLAGVSAVTVTLLTVLCFLGPVFGYGSMFRGEEFFMHLFSPLFAILAWVTVLRPSMRVRRMHSWMGMLPLTAYSVWYIGNILCNGVRGNDLYGLARWGSAWYFPVFLLMNLIALGVSLLLHRAAAGRKSPGAGEEKI